MSSINLPGGGQPLPKYVEEAPVNGLLYGRKDEAWEPIPEDSLTPFPLGTTPNSFDAETGDRAAAIALRDAYASANPSWVAFYVNNPTSAIDLVYEDISVGGTVAERQTYTGTQWISQRIVEGIPGPIGPSGEGSIPPFASIAERDSFFASSGNKSLLKKGLPVFVQEFEGRASSYYWRGETNPNTYDASKFSLAAVQSGNGDLYLANAHKISSSGQNIAITNIIDNVSFHPVWQTYEEGNTATVRVRSIESVNEYSDKSAQITNPRWELVQMPNNRTLYSVVVDFVNAYDEIDVVVYKNTDEYYQTKIFDITPGEVDVLIEPPFDIRSMDVLELELRNPNLDVVVWGNLSTGIPWNKPTTRDFTDETVVIQPDLDAVETRVSDIEANAIVTGDNVSELTNDAGYISDKDIIFQKSNNTGTNVLTLNGTGEEGTIPLSQTDENGVLFEYSSTTDNFRPLEDKPMHIKLRISIDRSGGGSDPEIITWVESAATDTTVPNAFTQETSAFRMVDLQTDRTLFLIDTILNMDSSRYYRIRLRNLNGDNFDVDTFGPFTTSSGNDIFAPAVEFMLSR
ncbi:hypothetical protein phiGrn1_0046 [Vibrio phage phi-Grn1]|uniref:Uncharacterized protein n=1 Tax=Vibrio phage phi-Grn1 TaxID=1747713 RepID=A0A126HGJ5_9CAUD|nr:hypothetical protein phiGrn1_0046 [Vibrio phage phi-Grn1]